MLYSIALRKEVAMLIRERAINERNTTESQLKNIKREYKKLGQGMIQCYKRNKGWRWLEVKDGKRTVIKKCDAGLAKKLAYKRKLKYKIDYLEKHLKALEKFISDDDPNIISTDESRRFNNNPEIRRLACEYEIDKDPRKKAWKKINKGSYKPEGLTVQSKTGRWVRSKSEAIIDSALWDHGLIYEYENELYIDGITLHPDFTIINPKDGKSIIWEHIGKMDDVDYREKNIKKLRSYIRNDYIPMQNFITTFETRDRPLNAYMVETLIEYYFE